MNITHTAIPDVLLFEPRVFTDARGFFFEVWNARAFREARIAAEFVQDNHSRSVRNVLRGLHYQIRQPQGKLVRVTAGEIFDVAVDLRRSSATFGRWVGMNLSAENKRIAWIPPGFAHGFLTLSEYVDMTYKMTDYYAPEHDRTLAWNDADLGISWPLVGEPVLSAKDAAGKRFKDADTFD
jgi:dTDP-4-dehydrorhamnose 3,5-epimerase